MMRNPRNRKRRGAAHWAFVLGFVVARPAFGQTDLRWRLAPGEQLEIILSQTSSTEAEIAGQVFKTSLKVNATLDWRVVSVDEKGIATIEQTLSQLSVSSELPGSAPVRYDSASQERLTPAAQAVADEFRPLLGKAAGVRLLPTGQVEDLADAPEAAPGAAGPAAPFSAKEVRHLLGRLLPALPPEAVSPGDSWDDHREQATPEGAVNITSQFTARGAEPAGGRPVERIEAAFEFSAPQGNDVALTFEDQKNRGVFDFDAAAGRLVRGEIRQAMTLQLRADASQVSQKARGLMTITVRPNPNAGSGAAAKSPPPP
jgi:hypothetical protein